MALGLLVGLIGWTASSTPAASAESGAPVAADAAGRHDPRAGLARRRSDDTSGVDGTGDQHRSAPTPGSSPCSRSAACSTRCWSTPSSNAVRDLRAPGRPGPGAADQLHAAWSCPTPTYAALLEPDRPLVGAGRRVGRPERLEAHRSVGPARRRGRPGRHGPGHHASATPARCPRASRWTTAAHGAADQRHASARREAADLKVTIVRRPRPSATSSSSCPGVETKEITQDGQTRRQPVTQVQFSQLSLVVAAVPHGGQPGGGLPAADHRPGAADLRAVHRRRRRGRRGRGRRVHPVVLRPGRAADALVGDPRHRAVDGRVRHRRADRRAPVLDRRRHGALRRRLAHALRRRVDVVGHPARRHRRRRRSRSSPPCRPWCAPASRRRPSAASG